MNIPEKLQELRASVETLTKKYEDTRAMPEDHDNKTKEMEDMMFRMMGYVHDRISYLENDFYSHANVGHIPPIKSAGKMEHCLKALGLDSDYKVWKPTVAAAREKYGLDIE